MSDGQSGVSVRDWNCVSAYLQSPLEKIGTLTKVFTLNMYKVHLFYVLDLRNKHHLLEFVSFPPYFKSDLHIFFV